MARDPTQDSIVNGAAGAPAFRVAANDVEIRGFTIQNTTNDAGISIPSTFSGTRIHKNLIQENTSGVKRSEIDDNSSVKSKGSGGTGSAPTLRRPRTGSRRTG